MKMSALILLLCLGPAPSLLAQSSEREQAIYSLIADYARARETGDDALLSRILTPDVDQLVSSGTRRNGKAESIAGMMRSTQTNPGERTITVDKVRFLNAESAIADAKYEIRNPDGSTRRMWSTFVIVFQDNMWKISAIRNMLPTGHNAPQGLSAIVIARLPVLRFNA
jgi:uncharacterized protein (TIGR02246 family)